jgi:hypothetical protein
MRVCFLSLILTVTFLAGCSCSSGEKSWGVLELVQIAQKYDPTASDVSMPPAYIKVKEGEEEKKVKNPAYYNLAVLCTSYPQEGCKGIIGDNGIGKRVVFRGLQLIVLRYDSTKNACKAALEIGQWYSRNWLFDDVTGEPILEDFLKKAYDAKRPTKPSDCEF